MKIDLHTHILPLMDDGAKDISESLAILKKEISDDVDVIVATPHFYRHKETIDEFLYRRDKSYKLLTDAMAGEDYPEIILGAEVYFTPALENEDLEKLYIGDTDYFLLEMPYQSFSKVLLDSCANFLNNINGKAILAHIERYFKFTSEESVYEVLSNEVHAQVNCDSIIEKSTRKNTLSLIANKFADVLGTDVHNLVTRPPLFKEAENIITKKLSKREFDKMMLSTAALLGK